MGGETIKGENRGETTWGEISWGRNDFLPIVQPAHLAGAISKMSVSCCSNKKKKQQKTKNVVFFHENATAELSNLFAFKLVFLLIFKFQ